MNLKKIAHFLDKNYLKIPIAKSLLLDLLY